MTPPLSDAELGEIYHRVYLSGDLVGPRVLRCLAAYYASPLYEHEQLRPSAMEVLRQGPITFIQSGTVLHWYHYSEKGPR